MATSSQVPTDGERFIRMATDITALKRREQELEAARAEAERANRAKSEFLASVSHEIGTSMNGVMGFTELLLDTPLSSYQRDHLLRLRDAGAALLALLNDILDISKIEAGRLELESLSISPADIITGALSTVQAQADAKGLHLSVEDLSLLPSWIRGDPTRLRQILLNLLTNAIKFTNSGSVSVRCARVAHQGDLFLRVEVQDTGIGIPADRQASLFQDFSQIDRSTTRRHGGTGLGLAICKRLIAAMGGDVGMTSAPGEGSVFWFTIPLIEATAPSPDRIDAAIEPVSRHILVADDREMNQTIIRRMLESAGHHVTLVGTGRGALAALDSGSFDLVLMAMEMLEMDGISATRVIRRRAGPVGTLPIVALTTNAMLSNAAVCREAGMNDVLVKPIDRGHLLAMVARWTTRAQPPSVGAKGAVFDEAVYGDLVRQFGTARCRTLMTKFQETLRTTIGVLRGQPDALEIRKELHGLVSIAGVMGCIELLAYTRENQTLLHADPDAAPAAARAMLGAAERAMSAIEARFPDAR
jgi:CheY-like chemotaxis protein/nitrogen-specific signal transduction histidine kinase